MPLIISPSDAALLIGAKCGGAAPDTDDPQLLALLAGMTERLAAAMNVNTLVRGTFMDRFYLDRMPEQYPSRGPRKVSVRLSNAYLVGESFTLYDEDGEEVTDTDVVPNAARTDAKYGVIDFTTWDRGYYTLEYDAGFELPDPTPVGKPLAAPLPVLIDTPEWMRHVVTMFLVSWYRAIVLQPKTPKDMNHTALMTSLQRELQSRIYEAYQRPRAGLVWSDAR